MLFKEAVGQDQHDGIDNRIEFLIIDIDWSLANLNMSNFSNLYNGGTNDIAQVACPVLLLWGDKDLVVLEYMVDETLAALKNATKKVYSGVSHTAITDIPDQFAADVLQFFKG